MDDQHDVFTKDLFAPDWTKVSIGSRVNVVVHRLVHEKNVAIGKVCPGDQVVRMVGISTPEPKGVHAVSLLNAVVVEVGTVVDLSLDSDSHVLVHRPMVGADVFNYVEVCAGIGLSSIGFSRVGFIPKCAVELQPSLAALHATLHPEVPVICADINNCDVAAKIRKHSEDPCTLMAGIACQPYSRGGLQQGGSDARAGTLPATLKLMHLLQSPMLVMECVVPARSNEFAVAHIQALRETLGFFVTECSFRLEGVWAANRYRWWLIAAHPSLGGVKVPQYPAGSNIVVRDLVPYVRRWTLHEEQDLTLKPQELELFQGNGNHLRQFVVQTSQKLPTALHSWGGQALACACGCRISGFSIDLLKERGIYAQIVAIPGDGTEVVYRHLHAVEVCILCGVPPMQTWGDNARLNLAAVGQMATPMHSVWIASSIKKHMQILLTWDTPEDPTNALHELKKQIWAESRVFYPDLPKQVSPEISEFHELIMSDRSGVSWQVRVQAGSTVQQLIQAESTLQSLDPNTMSMTEAEQNTPLSLSTDLGTVFALTVTTLGKEGHVDLESPKHADLLDLDLTGNDMPPLNDQTQSGVDTAEEHQVTSAHPSGSDLEFANLLKLQGAQFTTLIPPLVGDVDLCSHMRSQTMPSKVRLQLLEQQGQTWGDDEVVWHLDELIHAASTKNTIVLDPLLATCWTSASSSDSVHAWLSSFSDIPVERVVSVVLLEGHWTPCLWILRSDRLDAHCWDVDGVDLNKLNRLHSLLGAALDLPSFQVSCTRREFGLNNCGAAALAFLSSHVLLHELPANDAQLNEIAQRMRQDFQVFHAMLDAVPRPWSWGAGADNATILATLLQLHGVPASASTQRAKLIMQSLGKDQVQQAISSVSPWKTLKQLANQAKPALQLVLADELAAVVNAKNASKRQGKQPKQQKHKPVRSVPTKPAEIDPARLQLMPGSFCTPNGGEIKQIPLSQVGPLATGIALVNFSEALQFMQSGKKLTTKSLALLAINCPDDIQTQLDWSTLRFAATCAINNQPVLLNGVLLQLGNEAVCPYTRTSDNATPQVPVACARITVFQDQWPGLWEEFVMHPVKQILASIPALQPCLTADCDCEKWHPCAMEETKDALLDVFRRQYYNDAGKPVKAAQATHFSVQFRFLKSQELAVLQQSGQNGLYVEPRLADASSPSDEYQVVWMPQSNLASVQHASQCEPVSLGIARSGKRYGIRVAAKHFQQVFQQLKPDGQFLAPGQRLHWHCGPWPYGTDRKMLAKIFKDWQWQARPLQPAKSVEGGMMWLIQSVSQPSQAIWNMQHGQVLVSQCESSSSNMAHDSHVIGTQATVDLCTSSTTTDPWLIKDPWQRTLTQISPNAPASAAANVTTHLEAIEARLEKSILDKLPAGQMETDEQDTRIAQIESQLQHLAARHHGRHRS